MVLVSSRKRIRKDLKKKDKQRKGERPEQKNSNKKRKRKERQRRKEDIEVNFKGKSGLRKAPYLAMRNY
jgi:hypothetical protein